MVSSNIFAIQTKSSWPFSIDKLHFHSRDTKNSATILAHTVALLRVIKSCLKIQIVIDYIEAPLKVLHRKVAKTTDQNLHCNVASQPLQQQQQQRNQSQKQRIKKNKKSKNNSQ